MSLASYPRSIPTFPKHRNLWDDVDANHINHIQNEVVALASVLGVNAHSYSEVVLYPAPPQSNPSGGIQTLLPVSNTYQTAVKTINYGSVAKRLDSLQKRQDTHCFSLYLGSGHTLSTSSTAIKTSDTQYVQFPSPNASSDPFGLYNGTGVTLRKSGFYHFDAVMLFTLVNYPAFLPSTGANFAISVSRGSNSQEGFESKSVTSLVGTLLIKTSLSGFFSRGEVISLRAAQGTPVPQKISMARLSGFMVRES